MPQTPNLVYPALNESNVSAPLRVTADGYLETVQSARVPTTAVLTQTGGTIASGGTYQAALAANANRLPGGAISNTSVDKTARVYFGAVADAKSTNTITLAAGATLPFENVTGVGVAYTGVVAIDGTTAAGFVTTEVKSA